MEIIDNMPIALDAERFVLGSIILDDAFFPGVFGTLKADDFGLEKHRRIFRRMAALYDAGERIDRVTVAHALEMSGEYESVGGIGYICELDDCLPQIPNIDSYVGIVQRMSVRRRGILTAHKLMHQLSTMGDDEYEMLAAAERLLAELAATKSAFDNEFCSVGEIIERYPGGINALLCPLKSGKCIETPWKFLTEQLGGLDSGQLVVVAGRPGMGKTIVGMQMCQHAAAKGHGAAVFALEMSKEELFKRMVASAARVDSSKIRADYLNAAERDRIRIAANELADIPLWIDDTGARTMSAIRAALRRLVAQGRKPKIVMVDHVQLMGSGGGRNQDRRLELEDISHDCKRLSLEMECTVLLMSQVNRDCERENRRPQLADLRECGAFEQDADVVLFVHRPEAYTKNYNRQELRGVAEFIVAKQRNGPTGKRNVVFLAGHQRFECMADESDCGMDTLE